MKKIGNRIGIFVVFTSYSQGGMENSFKYLTQALIESFDNIDIFVYVIKGISNVKYLTPTVEVVRGYHNFKSKWGKYYKRIAINFSSDWMSSLLCKISFNSYISWINSNPLTMKKARMAQINFYLLKMSKSIVCICKEQKEILRKYGFRNNIDVIYNCVNVDEVISKTKLMTQGVLKETILMTARFDLRSKDFFTLIDAYSLLSSKLREKHRLVLLGDGPDIEKIKKYVEMKGLERYVVLPGFRDNPYAWMAKASVNVLSSKSEGFSNSAIEAMSCGVPLIITNYHTGAYEISCNDKNCLMVPIGDSKLMCKTIENVLENKELQSKLVNNSNKFIRNFDYSHYQVKVKHLIKVYIGEIKC